MITLQEITPYIPHNLKARLSQKGKFNLDFEYPNEYQNKIGQIKLWTIDNKGIGGILQVTDNYYFDFCEIDEIQIFVRPWSDITREIEHNGEKFIPSAKMCTHGFHNEFWNNPEPKYMQWQDVKKLFEWHFDVFGLIERGDAININTLSK